MPTPAPAFKLMVIGRRKPGTLLAEHRHHIRQVHGATVLRYIAADPATAPRRYVQNAVLDSSYRDTAHGTDPFALNRDFVTQIWFEDAAALGRSRETAFYKEQLQGDEDRFVDQATVVFLPVREREVLQRRAPGPDGFKLFVLLQRAPGADAAAFAAAWAGAPAALQASPLAAQVLRHVQNDVLPRPGGGAAPLDGIDEFWLDDEAAARALLAQWQGWLDAALVRPGLVAEGSVACLLAREDVVHAGPLGHLLSPPPFSDRPHS